ncbi:S-layer protein [Secundilactobacillus mixtipabuli]|uniref:S-layer protein n=1 Tax=Secundilactobacillus mixtipabuli TaxID=1435342 RepID=A0A1Z5I8V7_9LACO|nr:S-layer protein [Secundilactobacillus mixtipabuli]GAW98206.1 S-layer protein [Secundilactobacillus mixtipabuli]
MKSSLKKSLYVGLAAVSVLAASGFAAQNASAKSYAYVTKPEYFTTAPESRNVVPTGGNALYTKPGTTKGARVIASTTTMGNLAKSVKSTDFFRAYSIVKTNRGSVYYKVVSFDGRYRGWIYGGKDDTKFGGGITPATTTKSATMPSVTTGYTIADASKNTIWTAPKNTQYKAAKITGFDSTDTFTVTGAETKAREGSLYYQVKDDQKPSVTGWIYYSGLKAPQGNTVKVNYVDKTTGNSVGTSSLSFDKNASYTNATTTDNLKSILSGVPSGYVPYSNDYGGSASFDNRDAAAIAKNGDTVTFNVKPVATNTTKAIKVTLVDQSGNALKLNPNDQAAADASGAKAAFQVPAGSTITANDIQNIIIDAHLTNVLDSLNNKYQFVSGSDTPTTTSDAGNTITVRATYQLVK